MFRTYGKSWRTNVSMLRAGLTLLLMPILFGAYQYADWEQPIGYNIVASSSGGLVATTYLDDPTYESRQGSFEIRRLSDGKKLLSVAEESTPFAMAFSPVENVFVTGYEDGSIKLWNLETKQSRTIFRTDHDRVFYLNFPDDGQGLAVVCSKKLFLLDPVSGEELDSVEENDINYWAPKFDGQHLIVSAVNKRLKYGELLIYDIDQGELTKIDALRGRSGTYSWSKDGTRVAYWLGAITQILNRKSGQVICTVAPPSFIFDSEISPDGQTLATSSGDAVMLWDVRGATPILKQTIEGPKLWDSKNALKLWYPDMTFTSDGDKVVITGHDGKTQIWDVARGRRTAVYVAHAPVLRSLWGLLAVFLLWCLAWVRSGLNLGAGSRPVWDVAFLNILILMALAIRIVSIGRLSDFARLPFVMLFGVLGTAVCLLMLWLMMGGRFRWSLRVPGVVVGVALILIIPLLLWQDSKDAVFLLSTGAINLFLCLILCMFLLRQRGVLLVRLAREKEINADDPSTTPSPKHSARQLPLKDAMLWMAAASVFFAVSRFVSPQAVSFDLVLYVLILGCMVSLSSMACMIAALGKRPALFIPLAILIAAACGWAPPLLIGNVLILPIWWFSALQLSIAVLLICSLLVFRAHGYALVAKRPIRSIVIPWRYLFVLGTVPE